MTIKSTKEIISWSYGGLAARDSSDRRLWRCYDSDYSWKAVTDDFGELIAVTPCINMRSY